MPVAEERTDGTEFIGTLSALPGVQKKINKRESKERKFEKKVREIG